MMRGALLVVFALAMAGCASSGSQAAEGAGDGDMAPETLQATATTGVVRCIVVDETISPLTGALLFLDTGRVQMSSAKGACGFDEVEPGVHMLRASKQGFVTSETTVTVLAGIDAPELVRIQLVADPLTTPYVQPYKHAGHMVCSTSYSAACGGDYLREHTGDSATIIMPLDGSPSWLTVEAVWTPSGALGEQMILDIGAGDPGPENACCSKHGNSPIQHVLAGATAKNVGIGEQDLFARMFSYEVNGTNIKDLTGSCAVIFCHGPGLVVQQDFEVFVHAFHNWWPNQDYQFTRDGEPTPPS
jgi:hypothetical protein